jgi:hypothetical protein
MEIFCGKNKGFFLKWFFWGFSLECTISNANLQFELETRGYFQRQFSNSLIILPIRQIMVACNLLKILPLRAKGKMY